MDLSVEWLFGAGVLRISTENFNGKWTQIGFLHDIGHGSGGFSRTIMFPNKDITLTIGPGTVLKDTGLQLNFQKYWKRGMDFCGIFRRIFGSDVETKLRTLDLLT